MDWISPCWLACVASNSSGSWLAASSSCGLGMSRLKLRATMSSMLTFYLFGFLAGGEVVVLGAPPVDLGLELFKAHGLGLIVVDHAFGVGVFVEPDVLGGGLFALGLLSEEEDVGLDAGVGIEDAVGQGGRWCAGCTSPRGLA